MNILNWYSNCLVKNPLVTKCITTGFLFGLGDFLTQTTIEKTELQKINFKRTSKMAFVGFFYAAPVLHVWYTHGVPMATSTIIKKMNWGNLSPSKVSLLGVAVDQTIFASSFISVFFCLIHFADKFTFKGSLSNVKDKLWPTMLTNWKIWPVSMYLIFNYAPIQFRVVLANIVGLFWNMYLSYMQFKTKSVEVSEK